MVRHRAGCGVIRVWQNLGRTCPDDWGHEPEGSRRIPGRTAAAYAYLRIWLCLETTKSSYKKPNMWGALRGVFHVACLLFVFFVGCLVVPQTRQEFERHATFLFRVGCGGVLNG